MPSHSQRSGIHTASFSSLASMSLCLLRLAVWQRQLTVRCDMVTWCDPKSQGAVPACVCEAVKSLNDPGTV